MELDKAHLLALTLGAGHPRVSAALQEARVKNAAEDGAEEYPEHTAD
ncbi:hypothetical protein AB0C84_45525 [Actinomadura sp. NPDC048955]